MANHWDKLAKHFDTKNNQDPVSSDNKLLIWPEVLSWLKNNVDTYHEKTILDFGCGTGDFCNTLSSLGFKTAQGVDSSQEMMRLANANFPHLSFSEQIQEEEKFDIIVSIHTFHVLTEAEIQRVSSFLKPGGKLLFVVHHVGFVKKNLGSRFLNQGEQYFINLHNVVFPFYPRTPDKYDEILKQLSPINKLNISRPESFTKQFGLKDHGEQWVILYIYQKPE